MPEKYIRLVQYMCRGCKTVVCSAAGEGATALGWRSDYTKVLPLPVPTPDGCVDRGCEKGHWMNDVCR